MPSRRTFLATLGASAPTAALAGCTTAADDPPKPGVDDLPSSDDHIHGATGEWSSFGCNASNTRTVADGKAPVDGVEERWRVEVPQLTRQEPIAADGRVYQTKYRGLAAYDAKNGSELWTRVDVETTPLVRNEAVYVGVQNRLLALDPKTGETKWERNVTEDSHVRTPTTYAGETLYVPAGETLYRVDAYSGGVDWSRRLFGKLVGSPAIYTGHAVAVASEAGKLYLLGFDGTGYAELNLPSTPRAPPTADTDGVYCNCLDGLTYGVTLESEPRKNVDWQAQTGWTPGGLAVEKQLYAAGTRGLQALDAETGERAWERDIGDWRHTAPVLGRDTLFVGGDKLYAFDPTPKSTGFGESGPAKRFEQSFYGRVGPGPVLNDGVLYVVAQTGESSFHLLALE